MAQTKIAICGLGLVGLRHVSALQNITDTQLVGIVDPSTDAKTASDELGVTCYSSIEQLFNNVEVDGVVISTPTALHVDQSLECIDRTCPILVEKPLCVHSSDGMKLIEQAEKAQIPILVGHHRRHNPIISKAREIISEGRLGSVRAVHATCWFYKPDDYFQVAPWRTKKGAGPVSVNLVHDVDLIRYLIGEVISVQASSTPSSRGFENEEIAAAVLHFENGAVGTISVSDGIVSPWSWELTSREYPVYPVTPENCYHIGGSHGSLSIPDLRVWSHENGQQDWWKPISSTSIHRTAADPLVIQMKHFIDVVRGDDTPLVSGLEGLKSLQVVEAIQESARTKSAIYLENHILEKSEA